MQLFLLSIEEAKKLPEEILRCKAPANFSGWKSKDGYCCWWLRSPGFNSDIAAYVYSYCWGYYIGYFVYIDYNAVRPALHMESDISSLPRDEEGNVIYGKMPDGTDVKWIDITEYLEKPTLLMKECLPDARSFDKKSNDYEASKIKKYLEELERKMFAEKTYTHDEATMIVELFEDVLSRYEIYVPSPEDDEREEDNMVGLYGSTYSDLLDAVESNLITMLEKRGEIIPYEFSGNM